MGDLLSPFDGLRYFDANSTAYVKEQLKTELCWMGYGNQAKLEIMCEEGGDFGNLDRIMSAEELDRERLREEFAEEQQRIHASRIAQAPGEHGTERSRFLLSFSLPSTAFRSFHERRFTQRGRPNIYPPL